MRKIILILIISLISGTAFALETPLKQLSKISKKTKLVKIQSYNAKNYMVIKDGSYKKSPIEVDALIAYPKKGEGPFPVLMIVHSSGGPGEFNSKWYRYHKESARSLLKKGIAIMFLDNYSARGAVHTYVDQSQVALFSGYIDAFMALEYLSKDPKINIKKVGISGYSRGGMISIMASEKRLRDALVSKDLYFAAAQPRSPDCWNVGMFRNPQPIKETKTWMVLGGADDYTLAEPCVVHGEKIKANGGDIEVTVKKGWHHGFTANYKEEYEGDAAIFNDCPGSFTNDQGIIIYEGNQSFPDCITRGATIGGNKGVVFKKPFLKFFTESLLN
jgi:dienelactone hydrolase